ncbi:MAG: hypothetical protein IJX33_06900 [Akkermansia sp.]|nr:hypothetical protein [Akkermansia sp.]
MKQEGGELEEMSQCATDRHELRIELPLEVVTRLSLRAAAEGVSLEQLVAQVIARLAK